MAPEPQKLPTAHPARWLATWFGVGFLPAAPGTWGSLATLPIVWLVQSFWGGAGVAVFIAVVVVVGLWAADRYARALVQHDPSAIVIDEVAGQAIALLAAGAHPILYLIAFVSFRALDIAKPWPVGWADRRIGGGLGIMLDDILAGAIAAVPVWLVARMGGLS